MRDGCLLGIDPGPTQSAWVTLHNGRPVAFGKDDNDAVLAVVRDSPASMLAIEMIASYGMPVGAEVFDTCVWIGRFMQTWACSRASSPLGQRAQAETVRLIPRLDVRKHLCHSGAAKDGNVRQALIDRYGPGKEVAVGLKASPGPLYGVSNDVWQALGVAVTAAETER